MPLMAEDLVGCGAREELVSPHSLHLFPLQHILSDSCIETSPGTGGGSSLYALKTACYFAFRERKFHSLLIDVSIVCEKIAYSC